MPCKIEEDIITCSNIATCFGEVHSFWPATSRFERSLIQKSHDLAAKEAPRCSLSCTQSFKSGRIIYRLVGKSMWEDVTKVNRIAMRTWLISQSMVGLLRITFMQSLASK